MKNLALTFLAITLLSSCQKINTATQEAIQCCQNIAEFYELNPDAVLDDSLTYCLDNSIAILDQVSQDSSWDFQKAMCYFVHSYKTSIQRNYTRSLKSAHQAEQILQPMQDPKSQNLLTDTYNTLGILYERIGQTDLALTYSQKAQERYKVSGALDMVAGEYINQSVAWSKAGVFEKAENSVLKAIELWQQLDQAKDSNPNFLAAYNALAIAYRGLAIDAKSIGNKAATYQYFDQAIPLYQFNATALFKHKDNPKLAEYYHKTNLNLGTTFYHKGQMEAIDSAIVVLNRAIEGYKTLFQGKIIADAAYGMVVLAAALAKKTTIGGCF